MRWYTPDFTGHCEKGKYASCEEVSVCRDEGFLAQRSGLISLDDRGSRWRSSKHEIARPVTCDVNLPQAMNEGVCNKARVSLGKGAGLRKGLRGHPTEICKKGRVCHPTLQRSQSRRHKYRLR